jgi:hypothetical protein
MVVSGYTVQKLRNGYWITRLAPAGDRALPTNLEIEPPIQSVARTILDDCCADISYANAAEEFAQRFLRDLSGVKRGVLTIPASHIERWAASHAFEAPL